MGLQPVGVVQTEVDVYHGGVLLDSTQVTQTEDGRMVVDVNLDFSGILQSTGAGVSVDGDNASSFDSFTVPNDIVGNTASYSFHLKGAEGYVKKNGNYIFLKGNRTSVGSTPGSFTVNPGDNIRMVVRTGDAWWAEASGRCTVDVKPPEPDVGANINVK